MPLFTGLSTLHSFFFLESLFSIKRFDFSYITLLNYYITIINTSHHHICYTALAILIPV